MRRCLLAWTEAGVAVREIILSGAGSPFFARLVAAALDRTVRVSPVRSASAVGAALLAGLGIGAWDVSAVTVMGRATLSTPITARPDEVARSAALYERYDRASSALRRAGRS
jgi:xylulokinase